MVQTLPWTGESAAYYMISNKAYRGLQLFLWLLIRKFKRLWPFEKKLQPLQIIIWDADADINEWRKKMSWFTPHSVECISVYNQVTYNNRCRYIHLVGDSNFLFHPRILLNINDAFIVDPDFYDITEVIHLCSIYDHLNTSENQKRLKAQSERNFLRLFQSSSDKNKCIIYGTGPSIRNWTEVPDDISTDALHIICNSIIKNDQFMDFVIPDIICLADPLFHFGYNDYSIAFRSKLMVRFKKNPFYIVMPNYHLSLFEFHYPETKDYLIGLTISDSYRIPSATDLSVKGTENILTFILLPFAASLCDNIFMLGFDGRDPAKNEIFWAHHSEYQFVKEKEGLYNQHPSFFRDRNYELYALKHSKSIDSLTNYLTIHKEKEIHLLHKTFISALEKFYHLT